MAKRDLMADMRGLACLGVAVLLAGCDRQLPGEQAQAPGGGKILADYDERSPMVRAQTGPGLHLAYTHEIELELPGNILSAHFGAARDRCVNDATLHCLLLHAEIGPLAAGHPQRMPGLSQLSQSQPDHLQSGRLRSARLQVRLPHDGIAGFSAALIQSLPGEAQELVHVTQQATTADDLGQPVADAAQRVAELTDYLAALKVLGARLTISVSDQVKIAEETARAQTQMEEAQLRQRELSLRTDTEELDVGFTAARQAVQAADPVTQVLGEAQDSLRRNAAEALAFGIAAVPWVPVGFVGLLVLWVARRLVFGRRTVTRVRAE